MEYVCFKVQEKCCFIFPASGYFIYNVIGDCFEWSYPQTFSVFRFRDDLITCCFIHQQSRINTNWCYQRCNSTFAGNKCTTNEVMWPSFQLNITAKLKYNFSNQESVREQKRAAANENNDVPSATGSSLMRFLMRLEWYCTILAENNRHTLNILRF